MNFTKLPVIRDCSISRLAYEARPPVSVTARKFYSLSFRIRGITRIKGTGVDLVSGPGSLTFIPAGFPYRTQVSEGGKMLVMHFFTEQDCGGTPMSASVPFPKTIYNLFDTAASQYGAKGCDLTLMSLAYQLLAEAKSIFLPAEITPLRLKQCKAFIDENVTDPTLRIRTLAQDCGVSEAWFRREFETHYGHAPLEYIKQKRMENAKMLLQTGMYTVTEVAFRSGFESSSYFSAEFRRMTGTSPREYRNKQS